MLENTAGDATWAADGKSFFYTLQDENHRPLKTYRHVLGTQQADDVLVYEEKDTGKFTGVANTNSEKWITIDIHDHDTSEIWLIDAEKPDDAPRLVAARVPGIEYDVEHRNDRFIIRTNAGDAEDYKLVTAPVSDPRPENWTDLDPAPARHLHRLLHRAQGLADPHGARERAAAHRGAQHGDRRGTCHRLRRGGLFAGLRRDARIRHRHAALHLFVA